MRGADNIRTYYYNCQKCVRALLWQKIMTQMFVRCCSPVKQVNESTRWNLREHFKFATTWWRKDNPGGTANHRSTEQNRRSHSTRALSIEWMQYRHSPLSECLFILSCFTWFLSLSLFIVFASSLFLLCVEFQQLFRCIHQHLGKWTRDTLMWEYTKYIWVSNYK